MDVEHVLPALNSGVEHNAEIGEGQLPSDSAHCGKHAGGRCGVGSKLGHIAEMRPRNHHDVYRRLRVDVLECDGERVLAHPPSRNPSGSDVAEQAARLHRLIVPRSAGQVTPLKFSRTRH